MNLDLWKDFNTKVNYILTKVKEEKENDFKLKGITQIIFEIISEDKAIKSGKNKNQLFFLRFADLIYTLFKIEKEEREKMYKTDVSCLKNNDICKIIQELEKVQIFKEKIENKFKAYLCEIILSYLKKQKYSLIEYIDAIIGNMLFISNMNVILLKYEIYSLLINKYFSPFFGDTINFEETEINLDDDISCEIIIDLIENIKNDKIKAFQTLIALKYESVRDSIINYNINQINEALLKTEMKIENEPEISPVFYYEQIVFIFEEQLEELLCKKKRKKKKKTKKKSKVSYNNYEQNNANEIKERKNIAPKFIIYDYVPKNTVKNNNIIPIHVAEKDEEKKLEIKQNIQVNNINIKNVYEGFNNINKEFDKNNALNKEKVNNNINFGDIIRKNIDELLNKIEDMNEKEDRTKCISELKDIIFKLIDDNNRMLNEKINKNQNEINSLKSDNKNITLANDNLIQEINSLKLVNDNLIKEIDSLKKDNEALKSSNDNMIKEINSIREENDDLNEDIDNMEIRIEKLENKNEEIKDILGNIQIRDLGKNFLKTFNKYLTPEDFTLIEKDYSQKGQVIANRIKTKFHKFCGSQKMNIIINLILTAFHCLNEGNYFAHSIITENFEDDIEEYKNKKKVKSLNCPGIIIYLFGLGIEEKYFDNSLKFLMTFFNEKLNLKKNSHFLEEYFK
jgi:hypothetical protein